MWLHQPLFEFGSWQLLLLSEYLMTWKQETFQPLDSHLKSGEENECNLTSRDFITHEITPTYWLE